MNQWQVATAAEAITAAQFARLGFDVSVQYGANQPEYDLVVVDGAALLKISVKGSANGGWGLTQTQLARLKKANCHGAADEWLKRHKPRTAICLVQFKDDVGLSDMPRVYLATPSEIAASLKAASGGRGDTIIWDNYIRGPRAAGAGTNEKIPDSWRLSRERVEQIVRGDGGGGWHGVGKFLSRHCDTRTSAVTSRPPNLNRSWTRRTSSRSALPMSAAVEISTRSSSGEARTSRTGPT